MLEVTLIVFGVVFVLAIFYLVCKNLELHNRPVKANLTDDEIVELAYRENEEIIENIRKFLKIIVLDYDDKRFMKIYKAGFSAYFENCEKRFFDFIHNRETTETRLTFVELGCLAKVISGLEMKIEIDVNNAIFRENELSELNRKSSIAFEKKISEGVYTLPLIENPTTILEIAHNIQFKRYFHNTAWMFFY